MELHRNIENLGASPFTVATLGTFDGIHLGHRALLTQVAREAAEHGGQSVVVTFDPPPRLVLHPEDKDIRFLNSMKEKISLVSQCGINHMLILPFDAAMAEIDPEEFTRRVFVEALHVDLIVLGHDHHFGRHGKGNIFTLKALAHDFGFRVEKLEAVDKQGQVISSTRIREALGTGQLELANALLGYDYTLKGIVVEGQKLGRTIGYPTANLKVNYPWKLIPANGVYAVEVQLGEEIFAGMCNIGFRPTVNGLGQTVEVNIFDFDRDIYGQPLTLRFKKKTRDEKKFPGLDALKAAIHEDERIIRGFIDGLSV